MNGSRTFYCAMFLILALLLFLPDVLIAACVKRALTSGEQTYYEQVKDGMEKALPAPDNWRRQVLWMNVPKTVCKGFENNPVLYGGQFKFMEITELDRTREEMARRQMKLEDKIMAASSRGDIAEVNRLKSEMQRVVSENLEALRKAQEAARNNPKPEQMIAKFRVNEKRKVIGKKFEIAVMSHTTRTFERVNAKGTDRETITKMLYIGDWRVEDFMKNWNLFRPEAPYNEVGGIRLQLTGKRQQVENYLSSRTDIGLLENTAK